MEKRRRITSIVFGSLLVLSVMALNGCACCSDAMYLGNPNRPGTVWQPPECEHGCWRSGYYMRFLRQPTCHDVAWVDGECDHCKNWIPAYFRVLRYTIVNPRAEACYPGFTH